MTLAISVAALIVGILALLLATIALAISIGLKNSTHKIEWLPALRPRKGESDSKDAELDDTEDVPENLNVSGGW